jgi:hypothetical protein
MKNITRLTTILLLLSLSSLHATTVYYNGEGDDTGEWLIQEDSDPSASLTEVYDTTLNSTVMQFSEAGTYRLRLPNALRWENTTENILSFDANMDSFYTIFLFVDTLQGGRKLFFNPLNTHAGHHNNEHLEHVGDPGTGIISSYGRHRTHRDNRDHNRGWLNNPNDNNNRNGWVHATIDLNRMLVDIEPNNRVTSVLSLRIAGSAGMIDNVTLNAPTMSIKSTQVTDWAITSGVPEGGSIERIDEGVPQGNVIQLNGTVESSSFTTGAKEGVDAWNDTQNDIIQWKIKTENWFKVIVHVNTTNGVRDVVYFPERVDRRFNSETNEIGIGIGNRRHLGDASPDNNDDGIPDYDIGTGGTWQTFTRSIGMEVAEYEEGNSLISINGMTVIGTNSPLHNSAMIESSITIDDIQLFSSPTPSQNESANNLTSSDIGTNSATISFTDRAEGESGFRVVDNTTGEQIGVTLNPLENRGLQGVATLTGLQENHTYPIRIETLFDDGRETLSSEIIEVTTIERHEEAINLNRWSLRENSVKISFVDQAEGEIGFRLINEATGEALRETLPATTGVGTSSIGRINSLIAGTTYRVVVHTIFDDERATSVSEAIEFTTLGTPPEEHNEEAATDLHRWQLRETTVRVSFIDQAEGEIGFRLIDEATGDPLGNTLPATNGTGTSSIGRINGLTEGTTYRVVVHTLFDDGRATAVSEALEFTTLGTPPDGGDDIEAHPATDLHRWRLRATSVKISFVDQSEGEAGFRYINADTGEQLGDDLPSSAETGGANIGRINSLTANTTYDIQVQTFFEGETEATLSETMTFITLAE